MVYAFPCCRYAWECQTPEGGWGLDQILRDSSWKFRGIVNGMDYNEWSPQQDVHLQSDGYQNYSQANLREGKAKCKEALQRVWFVCMLCVVTLIWLSTVSPQSVVAWKTPDLCLFCLSLQAGARCP